MSTLTHATSPLGGDRSTRSVAADARTRARRRAMQVTTVITLLSVGLLVDLLLVRHTLGEEIWGPITAAMAALTGVLSLAVLYVRSGSRTARYIVIALWLTVAVFGYGGYNDHRLPRPADTAADQRVRPPLAPLVFTVIGIAGAVTVRSGTKGN